MTAKKKVKAKKKVRKKSSLAEKLHKVLDSVLVVVAIVVVLGVFGGAYFFIIAPGLIPKPFIEEPVLPSDALERINLGESVIGSDHINYVINEVGAYKLKKSLGSGMPIIEFIVTDTNERYYAYVKENKPITKKGNAKGEDIILKGSQETIFNILSSDNVQAAVKEANSEGKIDVEFTSDMKTLAAKGYLSLYDALK